MTSLLKALRWLLYLVIAEHGIAGLWGAFLALIRFAMLAWLLGWFLHMVVTEKPLPLPTELRQNRIGGYGGGTPPRQDQTLKGRKM